MLKLWSLSRPIVCIALLFGMVNCENSAPDNSKNYTGNPGNQALYRHEALLDNEQEPPTRQWIAKTARTLRNGAGISWEDDIDALMTMSRAQIVDHFMKDPRFIDTVLDFNLYFLGFKPNQLSNNMAARYNSIVYDFPQAISAAKEVAKNGDYFTLFKLSQPFYITPFSNPNIPDEMEPPDFENMSRSQKRTFLKDYISTKLSSLNAAFKSPDGGLDKTIGCNKLIEEGNIFRLFPAVSGLVGSEVNSGEVQNFFLKVFTACSSSNLSVEFILEAISQYSQHYAILTQEMELYDDTVYKIANVSDIKHINGEKVEDLATDYWLLKLNSSTNFNRKRAAHFLKTYFCDDLTPINIAAPEQHGDDKHGSDPSCQACHYKLDPMAGFFRERGFAGFDFSKSKALVFDDLAMISGTAYDAYIDSWKRDSAWNVGYIRSLRDPSLNSYELDHQQPMKELFRIISEAPEAKKCLVKRMSEYFVSKDQVFDGGFLEQLTTQLMASNQSSGQNFKEVVKDLVLSRTFSQANPNAKVCYDPPSAEASGNLCEVSFIIQNRCSSCHSSFNLADPTMQNKILNRLQHADLNLRMPLRMDMPDTERVTLIKWLDQALNNDGDKR